MSKSKLLLKLLSAIALVGLAGCNDNSTSVPPSVPQTAVDSFVSSYQQALGSVAGLTGSGFADLVDEAFLDGGYNKAQMLSNLAADAASISTTGGVPADSTFPLIGVDKVTATVCNGDTGICMLTMSYVNPAPDADKSTGTMQVRYKDGKVRLYGDQQSS